MRQVVFWRSSRLPDLDFFLSLVLAPDPEQLLSGLRSGDRAALARAITLVESVRVEDREPANRLVSACLPFSGESIRVGITGPPGAGKSTLIEALGLQIADAGRRVAVLAVDPSSARTRGSILGDKTRMPRLAAEARAFIRPSPSGSAPGGIGMRTRESMVVVEAAGYDIVLVETVGAGQSDVLVHTMVDFFLLLALAGAGDELQGIKRGVIELADGIAVTKADGENFEAARRAQRQLRSAMQLFPPTPSGQRPSVHLCSAEAGTGLDEIWQSILDHERAGRASGRLEKRRRDQARQWFRQRLDELLREELLREPPVQERLSILDEEVAAGRISAAAAAASVMEMIRRRND